MKKEKVFSRALSAMLILFGVSVGAFGDDINLDELDDTHYAKEFPVNVKTIHPVVPNNGEIPSDARGEHIGIILYGGRGTRVNAFGGILPCDTDGNGTYNDGKCDDNYKPNAWYGENGKKQVVNFSTMEIGSYDITHTQQLRFGGPGSYVFGDIVTGGSPVLKAMDRPYISLSSRNMLNPMPDRSWNAPFLNETAR
ncbi:hypothetical protein OFN68_06800 [Campylobacter sp. JMF_07 ED4]|uniref:hypothetical protein n=1 Tax=Campylobacter sp. JMF_07 ED4 TaxID=2983840 RepID=UPI0022E9FFEA|nr:hypothetical protein [Campylobacter sp. JMF_07 ED4]MDA3045294.1 hypothetical protein [Campylobacter sp. JMF_07 ED4]